MSLPVPSSTAPCTAFHVCGRSWEQGYLSMWISLRVALTRGCTTGRRPTKHAQAITNSESCIRSGTAECAV